MFRYTRRRLGWTIFAFALAGMLAFPAFQAITHDGDTTAPAAPSVATVASQPRFLPTVTVPTSHTFSYATTAIPIIRVVPSHDGDWLGLIVPETITAVIAPLPAIQVISFSLQPDLLSPEDDEG